MLIFACLPFWGRLREFQAYKVALPGLNASAVGLVFAACFQLLFKGLANETNAPYARTLLCIGMVVFHLVQNLKVDAPLAIVVGGILGAVLKSFGGADSFASRHTYARDQSHDFLTDACSSS